MTLPGESPLVNILLVEDNPGDARLIREVFGETGLRHQLSVVMDGEAAMDFLRKDGRFSDALQTDLLLLDLNLPKKNGLEVLMEVKQDRQLRHIPVVILSSSDAEKDIRAGYDRHASAYITKPANLDLFIEAVRTIKDFWLEIASLPVERNEAA
ncbi:MAG TPA: response regulator [Anaerolineales bacterium]|jgi:CheY-like chemotaxis protein